MHSDLFLRPDSIFAVYFSIQNFNMPCDEISRPIHVIFNGDNFAQWSQPMRSYLKGRKLWLYISGDRPIPEQVDKEMDSAYAIQIENWESANHHIITWFRNTSISSIVDEFGNIDIAKEVWDLLVTRMLDRVVLVTSSSHANFIIFVRNQVSGSLYITAAEIYLESINCI